jgi:hypothetical protein
LSWITVGLSAHRVETLAPAEAAMAGHRLVALEEPPTDFFQAMLASRITITKHLDDLVPEFPEYSRRQCVMLRRLHRQGLQVVQVEPFMAELEAIHDLFDAGGKPGDLEHNVIRWQVYLAEKRWTSALLAYYAASASNDFDQMTDAVCTFARADAERGRLRDAMRADQLAGLLSEDGGIFAEAGYVHAGLIGALRRRVPAGVPVRPRWLMAPVVHELSGSSLLLAPGDRLTLAMTCRHRRKRALDQTTARLLAARSLIQVIISVKEEMVPCADLPFPHTLDDIRSCQLVERLGYEDCRHLYAAARNLPSSESRALVEQYAARSW